MRFILLIIFFATFFSFGQSIEIHSRLANGNLFSNEIQLHLRIYNNSNAKLDLSKAHLTYRFSDNANLEKFNYNIWWFSNGNTSDVKISFHEIDSREKFFKLYFTDGEVESGNYAEIQLRIHKTDWSFFYMIEDYSLPTAGVEWAINQNIVLNGSSYESPIILPPGEQNREPLQFDFLDMQLSLSDYSVFGTNEVRLADRVFVNSGRIEIHGSVGTGNYAEIGADSKITGSLHSRKNASLRERAQLLGSLRVGENYTTQNFVLIDGEKIINKPIPNFEIPKENNLNTGTSDIFVGNHETLHLQPGTYRDFTAYSNSELYLKPGKYIFRNFRLEPEVKLKLDVSNGVIEIYSTEAVTFSDRVVVSYENNYANPVAFKVYQHGNQDLKIGTDLNIAGHFVAPNASIRVSSRVNLAGWLYGKSIYIEPDTKICEPPMLAGLTHSKIAYAPAFNALKPEFYTAHSINEMEVFAKSKDGNSTIDIYRDGNKFKIKLYNSEKANIHPLCAQTEYSIITGNNDNSVVYVKENSECSRNSCDGSSWNKAFKNLQKGLESAKTQGKAVWLAEGNYNVYSDSILIIGMGTEIRGGFAGETEETLETRKGNINSLLIKGNGNGSLLFLGGSGLPYAAYLDMATVTNGNIISAYAAPILDYLVIKDNRIETEGGGTYSLYSDGFKISNSYIVGNKASIGGALFANGGRLIVENTIVAANDAGNGAAIYAENTVLKIRHSTIADNSAVAGKGIAFTGNANAEIANNIVWNNGSSDLAVTVEDPLFSSNIAAGEDGLFFTKDDGYALSDESPVIDKGIKQADIPLDIFQMDRTISKDGSGLPDLGAREWFPDLSKNFAFLVRNAQRIWEGVEKPRIISKDVDDYFPTSLRNSWSMYNFSIRIAKNKYMKDKHYANLKVLSEDGKISCGESRKFAFYRIGEENGMVEYRIYREGSGQFVFFAEKEMPSYDWYQVLKVCDEPKFRIKVEVIE